MMLPIETEEAIEDAERTVLQTVLDEMTEQRVNYFTKGLQRKFDETVGAVANIVRKNTGLSNEQVALLVSEKWLEFAKRIYEVRDRDLEAYAITNGDDMFQDADGTVWGVTVPTSKIVFFDKYRLARTRRIVDGKSEGGDFGITLKRAREAGFNVE